MSSYAVIGGTGVENFDGLEWVDEHPIETPFGELSQPIREGRIAGHPVFFLHRHGGERTIPPHLINYRANIWALHALEVTHVVGVNAVGGITEEMRPGHLLIPDQLIDYTWGREHSFDDGASGALLHIDFTEPYDRDLRLALVAAANNSRIACEATGVLGVTQGPRLETAAEIQRMARDGCDVVGMTGMPEAALARELGLAYASLCMVVNPAAGLGDMPLTLEHMRRILEREASVVQQLLRHLISGAV